MYMYVCICVYMYVCMYVCMYVYMYACMYVCICVYAYMYMYVCIILWGELFGRKCPTQNGRRNCPGGIVREGSVRGNCPGVLSYIRVAVHPTGYGSIQQLSSWLSFKNRE